MGTSTVKMHSSYSGGQSRADNRYIVSIRDERIVDLFIEYTSFPNRGGSWDFQSRAIAEAVRVFGGSFNWFALQDTNSQRISWNYKFVLDTLKFIATGKRSLDIYSWPMMLSTEPPTGKQLIGNRLDVQNLMQELGLVMPINTLLQRWVMQPGGIDDLIYSMHLLFGKASTLTK